MIKIWGRRSSSNVQAVLWCLAELEVPFERYDAGYIYGIVDTADYLALNPNGKIPTLIDGDDPPLWEAGAILRYLATAYGDRDFWPTEASQRAQIDKWAEWAKLNVAATFTTSVFWKLVRTAPSKRDYAAIAQAVINLEKFLTIADKQLTSNAFIAGDTFTLADIQFGHCLYRYFDVDIDRRTLPNLRRYYEDLVGRPHYSTTVMVSYDELRVFDQDRI